MRAENARLRRLLDLTPEQARLPAAAQTGLFLDQPGPVTASSTGPDKVRFFRTLFAARTDVYAIRWDNARTGRSGWSPAVEPAFRVIRLVWRPWRCEARGQGGAVGCRAVNRLEKRGGERASRKVCSRSNRRRNACQHRSISAVVASVVEDHSHTGFGSRSPGR